MSQALPLAKDRRRPMVFNSSPPFENAARDGARLHGKGALTAVLGPTNTGKTYFAIERLLSHPTGMIGLPLRLLAREVYDKLVLRRSKQEVALVTGEEKIIPSGARYWVATVEAMPLERPVHFLAIDEIQLAADLERGRIFTSRLLHARGTHETIFLGSETMRPLLKSLFPDITFRARERLSVLSYASQKKVTRLPRRTAVVAFSSDTVYAVAELIRRQRGGAAVVLGALSPRTRNAQAALYQSGEVDYLVATDAIGMGLNMDIDHVAFAAARKFDGRHMRPLRTDELAQVAGRAGRHLRDGSFGVTSDCHPFDDETVEAIEEHRFEPARALQWRTEALDFANLPALLHSLNRQPDRPMLQRARAGDDEDALARLTRESEIVDRAKGGAALRLLWDVCQVPDFRKVAPDEHARLVANIYRQLIDNGRIDDDWLAPRVERLDRTDGDIDSLSARIAHVRTWTYLSNRSGWLEKPRYWQDKTRGIEDRLSDALHEQLTQRFVDRRTSVLLKKLKDDAPLLAGVTDDGDVIVEGQFVGRLIGFDFIIDPRAKGADAKRVRVAAEKALTPVLAARAAALADARSEDLTIRDDAVIWWRSSPVARLEKGPGRLRPRLIVLGLDRVTPSLRGRIQDRLHDFVANRVEGLLGPLIHLAAAAEAGENGTLGGGARGVAYRLVENFGAMSRGPIAAELKQLPQDERAKLRKLGMRFGEYTLFAPSLLKPAPARLLTMLWALWTDRKPQDFQPPKAGLVSIENKEDLPHAYYYASGYRPSGTRAVRIDMLERLAGLIRTARNDAVYREGFEVNAQMMSIVGCSGEDFETVLKSLSYKKHTHKSSDLKPIERAQKSSPPASKETAAQEPQSAQVGADTPDGAADTLADQKTGTEAAGASDGETQDAPEIISEATPEAGPADAEIAAAPGGGASDVAASDVAASDITPPSAESAPAPPAPVDAEKAEAPAKQEQPAAPGASAPVEAATAEKPDDEIVLWRFAPRRAPNNQQGRERARHKGQNGKGAGDHRSGKPQRGDGQKFRGKKPQKGASSRRNEAGPSPYKGSRHQLPKKGAEGHAPRHRKVADPDSPFAVLADLKDGLPPSDKP